MEALKTDYQALQQIGNHHAGQHGPAAPGRRNNDSADLTIVDDNPFFCADPDKLDELDAFMTALREDGDSIGARVSVLASGLPAGLRLSLFSNLIMGFPLPRLPVVGVKGSSGGCLLVANR